MKRGVRQGFTLLELMVALAVLAVVATSVMTRNGETVNQLYQLERQTMALSMLSSHVARLRIEQLASDVPIRIGSRSEIFYFGDRTWEIVTNIGSTSVSTIRRIELEAFLLQDDSGAIPVDKLIAFVGQH